MEFLYDRKSQRYRYKDSGKFVSASAVRALTQKAVEQTERDLLTIGQLLIDGKINVSTWEQGTQKAVKNLHLQQYLLGKGGLKNVSQRDYGILGQRVNFQYGKLRLFAQQLITEGATEAQFKARLQLYAQSARGSYEEGREQAHQEAGFSWERRLRTKIESCSPCVTYSSAGWVAIGTLPNAGQDCDCRARCGCYKEYSKSKPKDSLIQRYGWAS